ncbi:ABC transporter ATP-binding protein [Thiocystis violascens]|uniref:ABC-type transport system involved in resistance to organic solvents, ATPase component n=1 Tax=Thiocystis violascens (strain ATCC 17096 / DSM 198 / 6111) TaxID=765911 RepID=I3YDP3_THIV6|nr:ABC transporter ATP-binding protein [Thiocystis violascens]AFL75111.1 ABC-type transport system involved in resistance to organic solvents, ATPase component [Thiocystis violascens DSM 198]
MRRDSETGRMERDSDTSPPRPPLADAVHATPESDGRRELPGAAASTPLVKIRGLSFRRGDRLIFDNLNLDIRRGSVTAVMGPSGSGKTTLLKLITGQIHPDAGRVEVDGEDVHRLDKAGLYRLRRRMGMLFQSGALLTDLTVFENVAYPLREHTDLSPSLLRKLVLLKLEAVGLRGARDLLPNELSGGMARRVALARAIALDPLMILYDEPFTGQDPISMGMLVALIRQLNDAAGLTSILVSHDVRETASIADDLYVIAEGRIIAHGTPAEIAADRSAWVRQFMDGLPDGPMHFHYPAPPLEADFRTRGAR